MRATTKQLMEIHVNCPDDDTAQRIGDQVVADHLVACANVLGPLASTYRWQGAIEHDPEVLLILKTRPRLFDAVAEAVRALHPDDVPCITGHLVTATTTDYLDWVHESTREP